MLKTSVATGLLTLALTVGQVHADGHATGPITNVNAAGGILGDANGMSLYTFDKDQAGKSNCNGGCAANWPPLLAKDGAKAKGDLSIIKRADNTRQWAYKGQPLYLWINDRKAGDTTGDGVNGVWHLARP